jgi:Protein of unknown function (DUF1553)/Protein of unknown function (DUF1549)
MLHYPFFAYVTLCVFSAFALAGKPDLIELKVYPESITLSNKEARQTIIAQWNLQDKIFSQATDVSLASNNSAIAKIENGIVIPVSNGSTTITASSKGKRVALNVTVTGQDKPFTWSFRNHVESVLSKQGCNGGACHGARAGQKGFRLALFGFDVEADYNYLTRQAGARRIVPSDPGRSLLLTKPTGLLPHKGGVKLDAASLEYRVLAEWIAAGTPGPTENDAQISKLEIYPPHSVQNIDYNKSQQLIVLAHFNNGTVEDVTRWTKFTATNSSVASVDNVGNVKILGSGESAINAWYLNLTTSAVISVPYKSQQTTGSTPESFNFLDIPINQKLQALNIKASPLCDDATFIRRATLDTIGMLPTAAAVKSFLNDKSPDKRARLIEELLTRPEYVDYWTYKWSDLLLVTGDRLRPVALQSFNKWIRDSVAADKPWDSMVREIITATGSTHENGAANFYALHQDPETITETVAQAFMGLSINCAKCHNHPLEKWTNDQYYGMANMFSRVRSKGWGGDFRNGDGLRIIYSDTQGELLQPSRGLPQSPRPLDGTSLEFSDTQDRRVPLAEWLTAPENPYFSRAIANRIWANFFGVGIVEKVDDLRKSNPPSNEVLLQTCADYLVQEKFQLKSLMRQILLSAAYQRSSQVLPENKVDTLYYSRYYPRRMKAEVLLDALSQTTGIYSEYKDIPKGTRALQLADTSIASYFLDTFGRPDRIITCDCERSDEPSMPQVLHLYNGNTINDKLQAKQNFITPLLQEKLATTAMIEACYLQALARYPTSAESDSIKQVIDSTPPAELRSAWEDVLWSLLTSREFLFHH